MTEEMTDTLQLLLLQEVPVRQLTPAQRAGTQCVWCKEPKQGDAEFVDLGIMSGRYRPQACAPCHTAQSAVIESYFEWARHTDACILCDDQRPCPVSDGMRIVHSTARTSCGTEDARCTDCSAPVDLRHPALPVVEFGEAGAPHMLFSHAGRCPAEEMPGG